MEHAEDSKSVKPGDEIEPRNFFLGTGAQGKGRGEWGSGEDARVLSSAEGGDHLLLLRLRYLCSNRFEEDWDDSFSSSKY